MNAATISPAGVHHRGGTHDDVPFVVDSWLESYRRSVDHVAGPVYWSLHRELADQLLQRSVITIACHPEDPSHIFGWSAHEMRGGLMVLHYVYVKADFRRLGLGRGLLEEIRARGCHYTHRTHVGARLMRGLGAHFNPYLAGVVT